VALRARGQRDSERGVGLVSPDDGQVIFADRTQPQPESVWPNPVIVAGVRPGDILGVLAVLWRRMAVA
jgi:hypothetical protein